jgi:hypothetical protein
MRETGGRIPWFADRHVNHTGEACPIVPEEWLLRSDRASIGAFLAGPVQNLFLGQILVEHGEPWPFGERQLGNDGLFEAYGEWVGTSDPGKIRIYLEYLSGTRLKGHRACPCGSNQKLRDRTAWAFAQIRRKYCSDAMSRSTYKGMIIRESLIHPEILDRYEIINIETTEGDAPWHVYVVRVAEDDFGTIAGNIKSNQWYAHFWRGHDVVVIYKDKIFRASYDDKPSWQPIVDYGVSLGLPIRMLDFPINA